MKFGVLMVSELALVVIYISMIIALIRVIITLILVKIINCHKELISNLKKQNNILQDHIILK